MLQFFGGSASPRLASNAIIISTHPLMAQSSHLTTCKNYQSQKAAWRLFAQTFSLSQHLSEKLRNPHTLLENSHFEPICICILEVISIAKLLTETLSHIKVPKKESVRQNADWMSLTWMNVKDSSLKAKDNCQKQSLLWIETLSANFKSWGILLIKMQSVDFP